MLYKKRIILNLRECVDFGCPRTAQTLFSLHPRYMIVFMSCTAVHTRLHVMVNGDLNAHTDIHRKNYGLHLTRKKDNSGSPVLCAETEQKLLQRETPQFLFGALESEGLSPDVFVATRNAKMCVRSAVWRYAGVKLRFSASKGSNSCRVNPVLCFSIVFRMYCQCSRVLCL